MKGVGPIHLSSQPRQPWRRCPHCGTIHDGMTGVNDRPGVTPGEGAVMICSDCGEFGVLDDSFEGGWRFPTGEERRDMLNDPTILLALAAARAIIDRRT